MRLGRVFNHEEPMLPRKIAERRHIRRLSVEMNRNQGLGL